MRILLQHVQSKQYYCPGNLWTGNAYQAFDFRHSRRAIEYVREQGMKDVQLVVKFEDPQWDEIVPLTMLVATLAPQPTA